MSFTSAENSLSGGRPVRLYQFSRGVLRWNYNSSDRDITHNNEVYRSLAGGISDDGVRQGASDGVRNTRIVAPGNIEVAQFYRGIPTSDTIDIVIFDRHIGETDFRVCFVGEIQSVNWPAVDRCQIVCNPDTVSMAQQGLRLAWERPCPHALYERGCLVDRSLFRVESVLTYLDGAVIGGAAFASRPNGWFVAGYIEWSPISGVFERRAIEGHLETALVIFGGTSGLELGMEVAAYAGCDQRISTCHSKFNNKANFGGVPHLPGRSPFDGRPIF